MKFFSQTLTTALVLLTAAFFVTACGKSKPAEVQAAADPSTNDPNNGGQNNPPTQPKLTLSMASCNKGTTCTVTFKLNMALPYVLTFNWATDDSPTTSLPAPPTGFVYALPTTHYTPTSGSLVFQPGETQKTGTVQNVSTTDEKLIFRFTVKDCVFNNVALSCAPYL